MQEYLLISQKRDRVMRYANTNAGWLLSEYETEDSIIRLTSVDLELELSELYTGVNFEETE